ncbi:uncharacterized protein [Aristolochia californica]|uniref:uncharacterized protein n=1 Tax=Aristolochia californica TaxID=171875 RepID=UPI0035DE776F
MVSPPSSPAPSTIFVSTTTTITMIANSLIEVPYFYWPHAIFTACYLINRCTPCFSSVLPSPKPFVPFNVGLLQPLEDSVNTTPMEFTNPSKSYLETLIHLGWKKKSMPYMRIRLGPLFLFLPIKLMGCKWVITSKHNPDVVNSSCSVFQLDVKKVFLNGDVKEEIYMHQPPSFVVEGESILDHFVFIKNTLKGKVILALYVDDIVLTSSDAKSIKEVKEKICQKFKTKDLGLLKYFMGVEVFQFKNEIVLSQRKYVLDIFEDTRMMGNRLTDTPVDAIVKGCYELDSEPGNSAAPWAAMEMNRQVEFGPKQDSSSPFRTQGLSSS